ncbi:hypothetical protein ACHWQZ_G005946 [Mnemiopsis leidyi]
MPDENQPLQDTKPESPDIEMKHGTKKRKCFLSWISQPNSMISILLLVVVVGMFVRSETEVTKLKERIRGLEDRSLQQEEAQIEGGVVSDSQRAALEMNLDVELDGDIRDNNTAKIDEILVKFGQNLISVRKDIHKLSDQVKDLTGQVLELNSKFEDLNSISEDTNSELGAQLQNLTGRLSNLEAELTRKTTETPAIVDPSPDFPSERQLPQGLFRVENCEETVVRYNYTCGEREDGSGETKYRVITAARRGQNEKIHIRCCDVRIVIS